MKITTQNLVVELESSRADRPLEIGYDNSYFRVIARWYCGEQRSFLPDNVEFVLANLAALPENVWFQWQDTNGYTFAVRRLPDDRVEIGSFAADESAQSVSYSEFLEAFKLAADPPDFTTMRELREELDSLKSAAGLAVEPQPESEPGLGDDDVQGGVEA